MATIGFMREVYNWICVVVCLDEDQGFLNAMNGEKERRIEKERDRDKETKRQREKNIVENKRSLEHSTSLAHTCPPVICFCTQTTVIFHTPSPTKTHK